MKSDLFPTVLRELVAPGHYSLTAPIELPLIMKRESVPLRFSETSRIELFRKPDHREQVSTDWLIELMKQLSEQYTTIRERVLQFAVSLQGELGFNGVGRDVELARYGQTYSNGMYFDVSKLVVSGDQDMLFQSLGSPIDKTSELGSRIAASYEIIHAWMLKHPGIKVS